MIKIKWPKYMEFWGKIMGGSYGAQAVLGLPIMIYKADRNLSKKTINHERIHVRQGLETLWLGLWLLYGGHWLWNKVVRGMSADDAYRNIVFEKEAYANQRDLGYLKSRRLWAWTKYFSR